MDFKVTSYFVALNCTFTGTEIIAKGIVGSGREYKELRFPLGSEVEVKFNRKKVKGVIIHYTKKNVVVKVDNSLKTISHAELVEANAYAEVAVRLEKNAFGPYTYKGPSSLEFIKWKEKVTQAHRERILDSNNREHQPTPEQDIHLKKYYSLSGCLFAFKDFTQLFSWFTLEDIQTLIKEGFEIKFYQKGVDYFDSFYSSYQTALAPTKELFEKIEQNQNSFLY